MYKDVIPERLADISSSYSSCVYTLYIDDSGTRFSKNLAQSIDQYPKWFALGGIIVSQQQEILCKDMYANFILR